jgi:hypothetical protein
MFLFYHEHRFNLTMAYSLNQIIPPLADIFVAIGTLLLAFVAYKSLTEARKASSKAEATIIRQLNIEQLRLQLGGLYSPFVNSIDRHINEAPKYDDQSSDSYRRFFELIRTNAYLAGPIFREPLIEFLKAEAGGGSSSSVEACKGPKKKAIEAANKEYDILLGELNNLLGEEGK